MPYADRKAYLGKFIAATPLLKVNRVASKGLTEYYASMPPDRNTPWGGMRTQYFAKMTRELTDVVVASLVTMPTDPMVNLSWTGDVPINPEVKHCIGVGPSHVFLSASFFVSDVRNKEAADSCTSEMFEAARKAGAGGMCEAAHPGLTPLGEDPRGAVGVQDGRGNGIEG